MVYNSKLGYDKYFRRTIQVGTEITVESMDMPTVGYWQTIIRTIDGRVLEWYDSKGQREQLEYIIIGYKKSGEPEYESMIVSSTIRLIGES